MKHRIFRALVALTAVVSPATVTAQARPPYSAAAGKQVLDSMATLLRARYADADTGAMIADHIQKRVAAGAYSKVTDWGQFVSLATLDLQAVNEDTHLSLSLGGGAGPAGPAPAGHGLEAVDRLEGNVGYLRMSHFLGGQPAFDAITNALRILAGTDAIIIDVRNSRGGLATLSNFIISHFTSPDTTLSLLVYDRISNTTAQRYTLRDVPGPRRTDVPLFVLTDDVTRSAAEDLTFVLQNLKRATVIGSRTAGAGRNNMTVPIGNGVIASVSITRVMEPGTRREWERVGVVPNVVTDPDSALAVAHREALKRLLASAPATSRNQLELTLRGIEAKYAAQTRSFLQLRPAAELARYVGTYDGGQTIVIKGDRLVFQLRVAQPRETLSPVGDGTFASGATRYRFTVNGTSTTLTVTSADGSSSTFTRSSATVAPRK